MIKLECWLLIVVGCLAGETINFFISGYFNDRNIVHMMVDSAYTLILLHLFEWAKTRAKKDKA